MCIRRQESCQLDGGYIFNVSDYHAHLTGACTLIQEELGFLVLWLACMHHRCELLLKVLWLFLLDIETKGPADLLCLRFRKFFDSYTGPRTIKREDCPHIKSRNEPLFRRLHAKLVDFYNEVNKDSSKAFSPRNDYKKVWEYSMVILID